MTKLCLLLVLIIMTMQTVSLCNGNQLECNSGKTQNLKISINSKRNKGGVWETRFSAAKNTSLLSDVVDLDLTQAVTECVGHRYFTLQGVIKAETERNILLFHKSCSANGAITNNGRSLQKFKQNGKAAALTDRPLMDDEIFNVRLDKRGNEYPIAIGVTTHVPGSIDLPDHINTLKSGTWIIYNDNVHSNGAIIYGNFMKSHLKDTKVGEHIGVMRSKFGVLHVFINGVDQGPAAPNIPESVYGVVELYDGGFQATIID